MIRVPVEVDSHLRLRGVDVGDDILELICEELTIPNSAYEEAKRRRQFIRPEMQSKFVLWDYDNDDDILIMPRGYALELKLLLREHDMRVRWRDYRVWESGKRIPFNPFTEKKKFSQHQNEAVAAWWKHQQGIYEAPTGSGKTITACRFISKYHPRYSLILVDRINLIDQWIRRIEKHLGHVKIGVMAEGEWNHGRIDIATVQTLWSKRAEIDDLYQRYSIAKLDECHHVTAEMYQYLVTNFGARIRGGMSATPRKTGEFELALNTLGEVFHVTSHEVIADLGIVVKPKVEVVDTGFEFTYWGDHESEKNGDCDVPGCKLKHRHRHRNNYGALKPALVNDEKRNQKIAKKIMKVARTGKHHQLVITDQTGHIDAMMNELSMSALVDVGAKGIDAGDNIFAGKIYTITGKDKRDKRDKMIKEIENSDEAIIFSTIAGEALDIPIIDRVHLPWPTSNAEKTKQNVGRGTRSIHTKTDTIVYDYADTNVKVLAKQFRNRAHKCYHPLGYEIIGLDES